MPRKKRFNRKDVLCLLAVSLCQEGKEREDCLRLVAEAMLAEGVSVKVLVGRAERLVKGGCWADSDRRSYLKKS